MYASSTIAGACQEGASDHHKWMCRIHDKAHEWMLQIIIPGTAWGEASLLKGLDKGVVFVLVCSAARFEVERVSPPSPFEDSLA